MRHLEWALERAGLSSAPKSQCLRDEQSRKHNGAYSSSARPYKHAPQASRGQGMLSFIRWYIKIKTNTLKKSERLPRSHDPLSPLRCNAPGRSHAHSRAADSSLDIRPHQHRQAVAQSQGRPTGMSSLASMGNFPRAHSRCHFGHRPAPWPERNDSNGKTTEGLCCMNV